MARALKEYPLVALCLENLAGKIDFAQVFGRAGPVHIEIGTGKATFLLNQAKAQPGVNFLGIERANKFYRYAVDRIGRWGLTNVRIVRTDAVAFLAPHQLLGIPGKRPRLVPDNWCGVPDGCVDCFHIYFPDPWPKRRHHKRRFLNQANLQQLLRCTKPGGQIRIATDDGDYFNQIQQLIAAQSENLEAIEFTPATGAKPGELTGTNYERKYIKDQRQIYALAVRKQL